MEGPFIGRPRLAHAMRMVFAPDWTYGVHRHDHNELIVPIEGALRVSIGGATLTAGPGQALHYPHGVDHAEEAVGGTRLVMLYLAWSDGHGADSRGWPVAHVDRDGRLAAAARWIIDIAGGVVPAGPETADGLLAATAHLIARGDRHAAHDLVTTIRRAVEDRLDQRLTLADLARASGLSRWHFAHAFRAAVGVTPMRWLLQQRVAAATALLVASDMPLRAIATRVGLNDEAQLARALRRVTGRSAGELRAAAQG
ncbi:MAG TPA: AraC family transcriptional regulator [Planctomycetota bacterium]|nr:AraC family transcriptional regulator [Planctomycetota bacterium]